MLRCLIVVLFHLMVVGLGQSVAQTKRDTLKETVIRGNGILSGDARINGLTPGQKLLLLDSQVMKQYALQSAAELLTRQMPVFVKSYGFNGLATLNFRGSSAAQSTVLWNGIPIRNAALGVADISTLPVMLHNRISILYGGSSALLGSGNVGGALLLESAIPVFDSGKRGLSVSLGAGSFGQYIGGITAFAANRQWYFSVRLTGQLAQNNFTYTNTSGKAERLPNSQLQSGAVLMQLARRTGQYSRIELFAWLQQYVRQIPPALFEQLYAPRRQTDASNRFLATWQRNKNDRLLYAKASFIEDRIRYEDLALGINSRADVLQYYQETGLKWNMHHKGQFVVFIPVQAAWMQPGGGGVHHQYTSALAAAYERRLLNGRLNFAVNTRMEQTNGQGYVLPGAEAAMDVCDWLAFRASVQRSWRVPTLNELYYFPGGNPNLKPEHGWTQEAGYTLHCHMGTVTLSHSGTVFNRYINDWIIWLGGAVWTPHNIAAVHSRGAETESRLEWTTGKVTWHASVLTSYILATTVSSYVYNDGSLGRQIPYTPRYNARANAGLAYNRLYLNYNHTYTGYRFTVSDESAWLAPFQTGNVQLQYILKLAARNVLLTAQINNIWNQRYQVVDQRPLPGANWLLGIKADL